MPGRIASMAQKPIAIAADVRTNWARDMPIFRRQRSVSALARRIIPICSREGGGGKYSSFDAGRMSSGRASGISFPQWRLGPSIGDGPERLKLINASPHRSLRHLECASHERMDPAEVRHDLAGLESVLLINGQRPVQLLARRPDGRRADAELRRVEVDL